MLEPYRIARIPVWGHDDCFGIRGEPQYGGRARVKVLKKREAADKVCARLNADYQRYRLALFESDDAKRANG